MIYAIIATEQMYDGLHGIEDREIIEVSSLKEAEEIAIELSLEVMNSYTFICDELEQIVQDEIDDNDTVKWTDKRIEELRAEIYNENVNYYIYELDEEKIKDDSYEQLEEWLYDDLEDFLAKYQKKDK